MAVRLVCDRCGHTAPSKESDHWLVVWRVDPESHVDLCTFACLALWAAEQQDRKVAAK
jgi:hypothetical protein